MNAKLCKQLRRIAAGLSKTPVTERSYLAHGMTHWRQRALHPRCSRAVYHRLKKEFRK